METVRLASADDVCLQKLYLCWCIVVVNSVDRADETGDENNAAAETAVNKLSDDTAESRDANDDDNGADDDENKKLNGTAAVLQSCHDVDDVTAAATDVINSCASPSAADNAAAASDERDSTADQVMSVISC